MSTLVTACMTGVARLGVTRHWCPGLPARADSIFELTMALFFEECQLLVDRVREYPTAHFY
jgi:hypothetical protein